MTITRFQVGFPIRRSLDQSLFPAPQSLSQGIASFIASCCQGIHQTPLSRLIRSGRRRTAHHCANPALRLESHFSRPPPGSCGGLLVSVLDLDSAAVDPFRDHRTHTRVTAGNAFLSLNDVKRPRPGKGRPQRPTGRASPRARACRSSRLLADDGKRWWSLTDSNRRPSACKADALPTELRPLNAGTLWWVEEDLNLRPHAYQACALTT